MDNEEKQKCFEIIDNMIKENKIFWICYFGSLNKKIWFSNEKEEIQIRIIL